MAGMEFLNHGKGKAIIYGDFMRFYSDLMGFYSDLMGFYSDLMGYYWDIPSGNDCYIAIEHGPVEIVDLPS